MQAYIFDIDGVITDPVSKLANEEILKHIVKILKKGEFVALNTGRSFSWVQEKILTPLLDESQDKKIFKDMFIVCEKGNIIGKFDGIKFVKKVLDDSLPEELQERMKKLALEFSDSLFYDNSKETMITFEMLEGFNVEEFEKIVNDLEGKVKEILNRDYVDYNLRIDPSHIALDIQYEDAGKHLGAERIEDFILENKLNPETIFMLGDSPADSEMAQQLQDTYNTKFIYVGNKEKLDTEKLTCEIVYPEKQYTLGALEFLENNE